ncbi:putative arginyl-tRNA synthetase [Neoconidiobolus thromboides FSU 785]|nr:putative arginyl-tRNA synthetase [Neoconidiobolus thromboides FSU 785]
MALSHIRKSIIEGLSQASSIPKQSLKPLLMVPKNKAHGQFSISLPQLKKLTSVDISDVQSHLEKTLHSYSLRTSQLGPFLNFELSQRGLLKDILTDIYDKREVYGIPSEWDHNSWLEDGYKDKKVVVEYSSPNIAKPFHIGHLRSSILGQFISNLIRFNSSKSELVTINYLGDWGKQYGLLVLGFEKFGDVGKLKDDPMLHLYEVYVKINQLKESDESVSIKAQEYFKLLEQGDEDMLKQWQWFHDLSLKSFKELYRKLNIDFDIYSGERESNEYLNLALECLKDSNLVKKREGAMFIDLTDYELGQPILIKKDGTSLYLMRDIATIIKRKIELNFDKMIYVVGNEQNLYMRQVFKVIELIHPVIENKIKEKYQLDISQGWHKNLVHIGFGRVIGVSTRKGNTIFLKDILERCKGKTMEIMKDENSIDKQEQDFISDQIATAGIKIQDFLAKRNKDYQFDWNRMLDHKGDTGVYLLYSYAKICGIERKAQIPLTKEINFDLLIEPIAFELAYLLAQFPNVIAQAQINFEPCTIAQYLLQLSRVSIQANEQLRVKGLNDIELSKARWLLFWATKQTLENGLAVLGLKTVDKM